jgi:protein SCO1/2
MKELSIRRFIRENSFLEKTVRKNSFWIVFMSLLFVFPLARSFKRELPPPLPKLYKVPFFELTNSFGKPFGTINLKNKIYLANFMFTSCPTVCPKQMKKIQFIQKKIRGLGRKVGIVSFSVHPEFDTPKRLFKYARNLQANPFIWSFLTGKKKVVEDLVMKGFKSPIENQGQKQRGVDPSVFDFVHGQKLVLVDGEGWVRGYYSTNTLSTNQLMIDIGLLANRS